MMTKRPRTAVSEEPLQILPERILIVDDEPSILFAYQRLLQSEGYCVDSCGELRTALDLVQAHMYYAIITDIRLSGTENSDGVKLLCALRWCQPDAKTIVVTGFGTADSERKMKALGATHYLEKPVQPSLIIELLKAAGNFEEEKRNDYTFGIVMPEVSV